MSRGPLLYASLTALVLLALHLVAAHVAPGRVWGANAPAFIPSAVEILLAAVACLCAWPSLALVIARRMARPKPLFLPAYVFGAAAFLLFMALRSRNHFLGDGYFRIEELRDRSVSLRSADFLDLLVHREIWRLLSPLGLQDPAYVYALVSAIAGVLAIAVLSMLSPRVVPDRGLRWVVPAFMLTMGTVQLFFGYVECYTLRETAVWFYIALALGALAGGSPLPATAALALASAFHLSSLAFAPSLLALYLDRQGERGVSLRRTGIALAWTSLAAGIAIGAMYLFRHQYGGFEALLPLTAQEGRAYSLFSPAHVADLANFTILVAPIGLVFLTAGLVRAWRHRKRHPAPLTREADFWILAAGGPLTLMFLLDPKLGSRDWDLMGIVGAPVTLAGLRLTFGTGAGDASREGTAEIEATETRGPRKRKRARRPRAFSAATTLGATGAALWGVSFFHAASWVIANHDLKRSSRLVLAMTEHDPHHLAGPSPRIVNLGVEFDRRGFHQEAYALQRKAIALWPEDFWGRFNLATMLLEDGRLEDAAAELREAVKRDPESYRGHMQLGTVYGMLGRYTESVSELRRAVELAPDVGDSHLNLGLSLIRGGWPAEGVEELRIARGLLPRDPLIEANLAAGYRALGEWGRARVHAEEALKMQPSDRDARLYLGESLLRMDDIDGARNVLEGLMRLAPGTPQANLAEELLKQAGGG